MELAVWYAVSGTDLGCGGTSLLRQQAHALPGRGGSFPPALTTHLPTLSDFPTSLTTHPLFFSTLFHYPPSLTSHPLSRPPCLTALSIPI
eukprot:1009188-Rhodomonas_salina.4